MRLVNGRLDIGENFSELSIFDRGALYLQPIRYERGLRALVFLFQSVKFNKVSVLSTINGVYTRFGEASGQADESVDNLLLQFIGNLTWRKSEKINISTYVKPSVVAVDRRTWISNGIYGLSLSSEVGKWRVNCTSEALVQSRNRNIQSIPNISGQVRYSLDENNAYWFGLQVGYALRRDNPIERQLPILNLNSFTERQQQILPQYALLKVGFSW